jgi:hypothetical protein
VFKEVAMACFKLFKGLRASEGGIHLLAVQLLHTEEGFCFVRELGKPVGAVLETDF